MKSVHTLALAALASSASAQSVVGAAEGFAKGVVGGGSGPVVTPNTNEELVSYLGDSTARTIVISKTFDFTGTEGTATGTGCAPWGTAAACQLAINQNGWCDNYQPDAAKVSVTYDKAGVEGINVASKKTILGVGSSGVLKGKGLRIVGGAKDVIIQNIEITGLNPRYVWGGDAITINNADLVWIDHVKTSQIGRQHIVLGTQASNRVSITNNEIDGASTWSATCNGQQYWSLYLTGSSDQITLKGNYIHDVSGRAPKVAGKTLLHAVNNFWSQSKGHAFEIDSGASIVAEGNAFSNVNTPIDTNVAGTIFTSPDANTNAACQSPLGRACKTNSLANSGAFSGTTSTSVLGGFSGKNVASAADAGGIAASVPKSAGVGKI